ncbi:hypothetical protein V6N13_037396 [Hibiscus sabdariffa]
MNRRNPSFVFSIAFAILASMLLDFKMHWWVLKDVHHMAWSSAASSDLPAAPDEVSTWIVLPAGIFRFRAWEDSAMSSARAGEVIVVGAMMGAGGDGGCRMSSGGVSVVGAGDGGFAAGGLGGVTGWMQS